MRFKQFLKESIIDIPRRTYARPVFDNADTSSPSLKPAVRKQILDKYKIESEVIVSNVDESQVKEALLAEGATPLIISKTLLHIGKFRLYFLANKCKPFEALIPSTT